MNQYLKNLLSVTEVLITKDLQQETFMRINPNYDYVPQFDIYDTDIKDSGLSYATFGATLGELKKKGYLSIDSVVGFDDITSGGLPESRDIMQKILETANVRKPGARFSERQKSL